MEGKVFLRGLTASLMIGLLGSVAGPLTADASVAAPNARTHAYGLPSDGWKPGQADMEEAFGGPFRAMLTKSGACAWIGSATVLWPAGYRVRFHPTELLDPGEPFQGVGAFGIVSAVGRRAHENDTLLIGIGDPLKAVHHPCHLWFSLSTMQEV